jgi:hypothetical protein
MKKSMLVTTTTQSIQFHFCVFVFVCLCGNTVKLREHPKAVIYQIHLEKECMAKVNDLQIGYGKNDHR